jgi:hypothetical protein
MTYKGYSSGYEDGHKKGRVNFAEEILSVFRMKKIGDIEKYCIIINKAKKTSQGESKLIDGVVE